MSTVDQVALALFDEDGDGQFSPAERERFEQAWKRAQDTPSNAEGLTATERGIIRDLRIAKIVDNSNLVCELFRTKLAKNRQMKL
jgi:hypothetical protein